MQFSLQEIALSKIARLLGAIERSLGTVFAILNVISNSVSLMETTVLRLLAHVQHHSCRMVYATLNVTWKRVASTRANVSATLRFVTWNCLEMTSAMMNATLLDVPSIKVSFFTHPNCLLKNSEKIARRVTDDSDFVL